MVYFSRFRGIGRLHCDYYLARGFDGISGIIIFSIFWTLVTDSEKNVEEYFEITYERLAEKHTHMF